VKVRDFECLYLLNVNFIVVLEHTSLDNSKAYIFILKDKKRYIYIFSTAGIQVPLITSVEKLLKHVAIPN